MHVRGAAAARGVPAREQLRELLLAANELGDEGWAARLLDVRRRDWRLSDHSQERSRRRLRLDPLGLHQSLEGVGLERPADRVARSDERLEHEPPTALAKGVAVANAACERLRVAQSRGRHPPPDDDIGAAPEERAQPLPLDVRPPLELGAAWCGEPREEVARVELNDGFRVAAGDGLEQPRAVDVDVADERQHVAAG